MKTDITDSKYDGLLLVIPAYNEQESIARTISSLPNVNYIIVNDGSSDDTQSLCESNGFNCLELPFNQGLKGAFQTGMRYALKNGYKYVLQFDADGQHLPEYIDSMIEKLKKDKCDIVIGSRFVDDKINTSFRQFGASMIRGIIRLTTRKKIYDPTSGMRIYNEKMIKLFAENVNYSPEPDTLAYLIRSGAVVEEIGVKMADRFAGQSYLTFWKSLSYMLKTVVSIMLIQFIMPKMTLNEEVIKK